MSLPARGGGWGSGGGSGLLVRGGARRTGLRARRNRLSPRCALCASQRVAVPRQQPLGSPGRKRRMRPTVLGSDARVRCHGTRLETRTKELHSAASERGEIIREEVSEPPTRSEGQSQPHDTTREGGACAPARERHPARSAALWPWASCPGGQGG